MELEYDYVKDDYCYGCKYAFPVPENQLVNPWSRRFYCKNKNRINERLANVSQRYREFCKKIEQGDEKYPLELLLEIRKELDSLWYMMREWNWCAFSPDENTVICLYKEKKDGD